MIVYTRIVIDMNTSAVLEEEGFLYEGPVALACGGPSQQQQQISQAQQNFYNTMTQNYSTLFAGQSAILSNLNAAMSPILAAGINQYGFSPQEDSALRTQATQGAANAYASANKALGQQTAAQGGGNAFLPSGANAQLQGQLNSAAAANQANNQLGITEQGYAQGRQNYLSAAQSLGQTASIYNPTGLASSANTGGSDAFNSATTDFQEQGSAWGAIGGLLGGVAGSFLGPVGSALGSKVGSWIGGLGGGGGSSSGPAGDGSMDFGI